VPSRCPSTRRTRESTCATSWLTLAQRCWWFEAALVDRAAQVVDQLDNLDHLIVIGEPPVEVRGTVHQWDDLMTASDTPPTAVVSPATSQRSFTPGARPGCRRDACSVTTITPLWRPRSVSAGSARRGRGVDSIAAVPLQCHHDGGGRTVVLRGSGFHLSSISRSRTSGAK